MIGRISNILLVLLFNAVLVKMLAKQTVGDYFLTLSFISFFALIATFGATNIAIKRFSDEFNNKTSSMTMSLHSFLLLNTFTSIIVLIFVAIAYQYNLSDHFGIQFSGMQVILLCLWIWAQGLQVILTELFRALGKFLATTLTANLFVNLVNCGILLAYYMSDTAITFDIVITFIVVNTTIVTLFSLITGYRLCRKHDGDQPSSDVFEQTVKFFFDSTPSFINKLGLYFTVLADIWLVALFFSKEVVADYGIAVKLATLLAIFLTIANGFVPTYIGRLKSEGRRVVERFMRLTATLVMIPTLVLFLVLFFKSDWLITVIFESSYVSAASFVSILIFAQLFNVVVGSCNYALVMEGMNVTLMKISIVSGVAAVGLSYLLVSMGGDSLSIAYAFTLVAILKQVTVYLTVKRYCKINTAMYLSPFEFIANVKEMIAISRRLDANNNDK